MFMHWVYILAAMFVIVAGNPATTVGHMHTQNKERVEDGIYRSRDAHHIESGEHHSEFDHEAILGSVKEAEQFDKLSPEESKKRLAILLKNMDGNSDGFIDRHELKAWILRSFKMLSEEEAADRFEDADENGDDIVTWDEYVGDTYNMDGVDYLSQESRNEEQKLIADDKAMFDAADANRDKSLTLDEFVVFINPEEHPFMLPIILEQTLKDKDSNNDGKINFQEYIGEKGAHHDKNWLLVEKQRFDEEFDKDADGILSSNEILSWIVPSNEETAVDEVDHLFASADDNHDNRLSHAEILLHHETFVGSEATDYGEHLHNVHLEDEL